MNRDNRNNRNALARNRDEPRGDGRRPDGDAIPEPAFERPEPQRRGPPHNPRRGGGQGGHRPPRQAAVPGVPQPQHRVTAGSQMKNDPLFVSVLNALPGCELRPIVRAAKIYPSAAGLSELIDQIHDQFVATSPGYARRVPKVAFAYYAATATYASMLKKVELNGFQTFEVERSFSAAVSEMNLDLPKTLQLFCDGFGNVQIPDGRLHRMDMQPRHYEESETTNTFGWFGRVGPDTHWMYRDYPNLASYAYAIRSAITRAAGAPADYPYPEEIAPELQAIGNPNRNFLGYLPRDILRPDQRAFLNEAGIADDGGYASVNHVIPLLPDLLRAVQQELDQVRVARQKAAFGVDGSQSQIPTVTELETEGQLPSLKGDLEARAPCDLLGACVIMSSAFAYRVRYRVDQRVRGTNKWSIYSFENYRNVPIAWLATANALREVESPYLQQVEMKTVAYGLVPKVRSVLDATMAPS